MKDGKKAEFICNLCEYIYREDLKSTKVREMVKSSDGTVREIDVVVELKDNKKIAFEVRERKGNQSIEWIDQVIGKYLDLKFDEVWVCTFNECSLSKDAVKKLRYHGIGWRNINVTNIDNLDKKPSLIAKAIKIDKDSFNIKNNCSENIEFSIEKIRLDSYRKCKEFISLNFDKFDGCKKIGIEYDLSVINPDFGTARIEYDLFQFLYTDYFSVEYQIDEKNKIKFLKSCKGESLFLTEDTLVVDFGYISKLFDSDTIINSNFIIDTKFINTINPNIKQMKMINTDNNNKIIPMAIYGLKNSD